MASLNGSRWWAAASSGGSLPPATGLDRWPRAGMSIAALVVASACNIEETVKRYVDAGVTLTRVNLLSALWNGVDVLPYRQQADGLWNLYDWNPQYFDRLAEVRERMNAAGIVVLWTNYELYSWSRRKQGPQQTNTPWRHNVNGVFWPPEDTTLGVMPDQWSKDWLAKVVPYLGATVNPIEIGNEYPEKALHERTAAVIRGIQPDAQITVNRNEDTPGGYINMKIGKNYTRISFHGLYLKDLTPRKITFQGETHHCPHGDLDRVFTREPDYRTFNEFFDQCPHEPSRIVFSSDGARSSADPVNTYDWDRLRDWFREMLRRGCSIEHQSRAKMTPPPNHHMIEVDWFKSVIA